MCFTKKMFSPNIAAEVFDMFKFLKHNKNHSLTIRANRLKNVTIFLWVNTQRYLEFNSVFRGKWSPTIVGLAVCFFGAVYVDIIRRNFEPPKNVPAEK